ncbi:hypothetical protein AB1Y20_000818 [Prymnesium parvum]|uniref:Thioesterase domain-containing protein n=1 Tax=Prymnesium parvum TaxID=97485 RepID=A0AB34K604_PRYPA
MLHKYSEYRGTSRNELVMGLIHVPRVAAAIARGYARRSAPVDKMISIARPHVAQRRAGLFDLDLYGHMNNAAFLTHFELARWELAAQNAALDWSVRERAAFILGGVALRYRKEIKPFQRFEVHTQFVAFDERWIYVSQSMQPHGGGEVMAQSFCRAVVKKGRKTLVPQEVLESQGVDAATLSRMADPITFKLQREAFSALDGALKTLE